MEGRGSAAGGSVTGTMDGWVCNIEYPLKILLIAAD